MADSKNMVIRIVSDAKDFVKGMREALQEIQSASQKAQGFDKIAEDATDLKEQLSKVAENLKLIESTTKGSTTVVDAQVGALERNVDNLNKKFDSFRHTFGTLQETVRNLNTDTLNVQMEKMSSNMKEVALQYTLLKKESESFLSNKTNINDITNISQLEKAFNEAEFLFQNFNEANKKGIKGGYSKEYQEAASALFKYAEALVQVDAVYADANNDKSFLPPEKLDSIIKISEQASKVLGSQLSNQTKRAIETMFSSIDIGAFFQKQISGTIENGTKGFVVKGAIEIPVKLKENAKRDIAAQVGEIIGNAQSQIDEHPIQFNFNPIKENENKLSEAINSYFNDISMRLQEQAQELNNTMGKILNETGIKQTQQNFENIATSITQLLTSLKDFSKEIDTIKTADEKFNASFSSENLELYSKSLEGISESFKKLTDAIDNVSTKLNKNGLESQFEIIKNNYSKLDLGLLSQGTKGKEKKELELIKEKKKQLRELFSLYSTYQARGGIRPITDLLSGESDTEKIKYFNSEYKKYIKNNKSVKKKTNKTDLGNDIFIPSGILETDKEQLNEILALLKNINQALQDIGKTGINTSKNLKPLTNSQGNNNDITQSSSFSQSKTRTPRQKPVIPSKKKPQEEQTEQISQETVNSNKQVIDSNNKLAHSAEEAAQSIHQEKEISKELTNEEKEKKINGLMYHYGNINGQSQRLSHPFGDELKSWFTGIKDSGRGWGDGTGLYTTKDISSFSKTPISDKSLEKFYAIDTSNLKLYEAHTEEVAKEFYEFIHHLEQLCISLGSGFTGFEDNLKNVDINSLYKTAQKLFPNFKMTIDEFDSFISDMSELVSKSGIKPDGTIISKQMYNFKKEYGVDDIKTRFLKQLGYQGTDLSGTSFGTKKSGNVIFDTIDSKRIVASGKQIDEVSQQAKNNILGIKQEIKKAVEAESELGKEVKKTSKELEAQNKKTKEIPLNNATVVQDSTTLKKKKTSVTAQPLIEKENIQEQVTQTENDIENSEQNILNLISNIDKSLDGLRNDLKLLAEIIVTITKITEEKDYIGQIEIVKNGIVLLNMLVVELANNIKSINFDKINKLEISPAPFDRIVNSLNDIVDLIERISGQASKTNLKSQFEYIQNLYNSMVNDKGKFVARGNKDKLQLMYSLYDEYKNAGGQISLDRLTESKSNQDKLYRQYEYYKNRTKNNTSAKTTQSNEQLKLENEALKESVKILTEVINNKQKLSSVDKSVAESAKSNAKEVENENQKLKELNNQTEKVKNKTNKSKKEQSSTNFTMVGEPYGDNDSNKNKKVEQSQNTSIISTNGFTMVDDGYTEDVEHTQVRIQKAVKETTKQIEQQKTELETIPHIEVFEGEVVGAEKELAKIYHQESDEFEKGFKSYEEAYQSMEERFAEWYKSQGYNHTKSVFNVTSGFKLKSATITRENPEDKSIITDTFKGFTDKKTGESKIIQTNIQLIDNEQKRIASFTKELERNQREREKLQQWIASFNNKTSENFVQSNQMKELNQLANDASSINEKSLQRAETLKSELETVYNNVVSNARKGSSSLSPIPNMMFGEVSRRTKLDKVQSTYDKLAINWNDEDATKELVNVEKELGILTTYYDVLREAVDKYNATDESGKRIGNIVEVSNAYGIFNEQLNKVNEQLNRMKIINTEINGNKINNLNNWFKDMPDPNDAEGKIEKYGQVYSQFVEAQQRLNELTTNLNRGITEEDAQEYESRKEKIHETVLELEELKKLLSSDSMNVNNQMGQVIEQNIPATENIEELRKIINEYANTKGKIIDSTETGEFLDKEGNEFVTFARKIQDTKGVVTEFEFTYDKAMGTVAVATKKVQEPESIFKTFADELTTKWRGVFTTLASFVGFYQLWGYFKQGVNTVREFDTALTEMQKVSDETISTLQEYQKATFNTADAIGTTALQIQDSTADFMRLGETLEEASESAKATNILMNVSEFESIDEATKSLIAMGAAYDNLSKMNIIDKLNEVGNNYAISTSEAATALQNSASALKTAGNDMDEALALITAGNAVVQDANKVGTGMRTIALRLTGTKSAKEELEEIGEETDNVIVSQSKLRDTIKQATAVASNGFKGFDILDDNGNYKSTYEIMLGIAEVYNEILETDKQLGRNNANLLLESVAGKNRANIAASIFQNPELLKEAYKSSQEAENSAMEENEKYMDSINGHIAQLQNAYQQLWANSMNRDTINYFIDLGKSILKVVDDVGLLGTAFVAITGIKSIVGYQSGKGFAYETIKGIKNVIKSLAGMEGKIGSLTSNAISAGKSIGGAFSNVIPIIGGIGTAIALVGVGINAYIQHQKQVQKELIDSVRTSNEEWKQQKQTLSDYASQYEELKTKLKSGNLSEQETIRIKQDIYDIQKQITEQYGKNVDNINLVNGELKEQLEIINSIPKAEANEIWGSEKYQKGFNLAEEAMTTKNDYSFKQTLNPKDYKTEEDKALSYIIQKYTQERKYGRGSNQFGTYRVVSGSAIEADERILKMIEEIEKLQLEYSDNEDFQKRAKTILSDLQKNRDKIEEIRKENESSYLEGLPIKLMATKSAQDYKTYSDYQSSVSNLEDAYITGDTKKINEARKAFDEASIAKDKFLSISGNEQFALLFSKIDTSLIDTKNRFQDTVDLLKDIPEPKEQDGLFEGDNKKVLKENAKAQSKLTKEQKKAYKAAKELYSLNPDKVDIKATLDNNTYASGNYADALNNLMNAMGWTSADADNLISALITAGIVQGDAADIANIASGSYDAFSSSVETAIGALSTLNTALSESAKGTGITEQILTELKSAFGDNLNSVLETTANGYHLNVEGAYLLRQQQEALTNADYASAVYEQYQALEKLQEGYLKAKEAGEDTSGYVQQRQAIQANIDKLNEDLMAFNNANSAYQTWLSKQSSEGEREMYNSIYSGYDAVKDELDRGFAGEKTRSWLDLIFNDENDDLFDAWTSSAEEVKEKFDEVTKDIEGTGGYSIADFFTVDANGKSTSQGIWNFFEAVENKQDEVGEKFVDLEEGIFNFGKNGDYQIADLLGMDVESVQGILRAAADAGFEIHLDQPLYSLEQLEKKAYSAKDALEETMGTKLKINLDPQSEEEVDDAMQKLMQYQQTLSEDTSIDPNIKTERLQQIADLMNFMAAKKREFVEGDLFNFKIDSKELQESKKNINEIVNKLSSYSKEAGKTEFSEQFAIDPMLLNNVDYLQEKIDALKEIRPNVDDTQVEYLDQLLMQLQNRVNLLNETDITGGTVTVDQFMAAEQVVNDINAKLDYAAQHKDIEFNWDADEEFTENLNTLANLPEDVKIDLGIPVDKNGEELLELAKKGELHIGIKTEGEVPKTGEQKGTTVTNTVNNEQHNFVKTVLSAEDNASSSINLVDQGLTQLSNKKTIVPINGDTKDFDKKASGATNKKKEVAKDVVTNFKGDNSDVINKANTAYNTANVLNTTITTVFKSSGLGGLKDDIQDAVNKVNNLNSRISTVSNRRISGTVQANGTAHVNGTIFARGTAFAGGKWGVSRNQQALVGELGTELLVRDGQWQTIGDNGAEFVNLKKGDIVFNHKQAQELLENGYITSNKGRGHLVGFANGTAYSGGTTKGAIKPTTSSQSMGNTSPSTKGTKGTSGTTHGSDNNNNNNNNTNNKAKETKNTLDEVEILIARIERQISNLDKTIGKTYLSWTSRNKAIKTNLAKVSKEIKDQNQAYTTYMKKANSIQITTGSKKTAEEKKKESEAWKAKIRNGKFKIEDVKDSDLWDKINEYKQW